MSRTYVSIQAAFQYQENETVHIYCNEPGLTHATISGEDCTPIGEMPGDVSDWLFNSEEETYEIEEGSTMPAGTIVRTDIPEGKYYNIIY